LLVVFGHAAGARGARRLGDCLPTRIGGGARTRIG